MSARFARHGDTVRLTLSEPERELLARLPDELRALYASEEPAVERLFPRAYLDPTEEAAEQEWQALVHPGLLQERLASLERIAERLGAATPARRGRAVVDLGADDVPALLRMLNDARLALGTRLGVSDDTDVVEFDPDAPDAPVYAAYGWLTFLEGELVETLMEDLPG
jgi:Domain of unknown function (DUF2017)